MEDLGAITDTAAEVLPPVHPGRSAATRRINMAKSVWTADRIDRLKVLLGDGFSCGLIAKHLGNGISRNAVIGKVSRMGLRPPEKRQPSVCKPARTSAGRSRKYRTTEAHRELKWRFPEKIEPTEATEISIEFIPPNPVTLWDLQENHCRFVLGEPAEMLFCGEPVNYRNYCRGHAILCYRMGTAKS